MAHKAAVTSAQKQICEVSQKGHTLMDSFDRVGAGAHRVSNLAQFASLGRTVGTKIDGASGRQGANAGTGPLGTGSNATTISRKDLAQFHGTSRAHGGIESAGAGLGSSKDMLGSLEPEAGLASGVENGTVDKQGNASNIPSFGADSRLATSCPDGDCPTTGLILFDDFCASLYAKPNNPEEEAAVGMFEEILDTVVPFYGEAKVAGKYVCDKVREHQNETKPTMGDQDQVEDDKEAPASKKTEEPTTSASETTSCENPEDDGRGVPLTASEIQSMGTAVDGLIQNFESDIGGISPYNSGEGDNEF